MEPVFLEQMGAIVLHYLAPIRCYVRTAGEILRCPGRINAPRAAPIANMI